MSNQTTSSSFHILSNSAFTHSPIIWCCPIWGTDSIAKWIKSKFIFKMSSLSISECNMFTYTFIFVACLLCLVSIWVQIFGINQHKTQTAILSSHPEFTCPSSCYRQNDVACICTHMRSVNTFMADDNLKRHSPLPLLEYPPRKSKVFINPFKQSGYYCMHYCLL
jgi:hypothetical protein